MHGHDIDQREYKHPDEIHKVPVKAADFNIFVAHLLDARAHHKQIDETSGNVEHVQSGNCKEGRAKTEARVVARQKL